MAGEDADTDTYPDTDPRHPGNRLPRPSPLVRGQGSLQALGLDGGLGGGTGGPLGGVGGLGGGLGNMLQGFLQMIMQLFHIGGMNLEAHDRHESDVTKQSPTREAVRNVQGRAQSDPEARQLMTDYNKAVDGVKTALGNSQQTQNASNFLALQNAEMDRSVARAKIVAFDAKANGDNDTVMKADRWRVTAMAAKDKIDKIEALPPDKRDAAMEKFAQENPNSAISKDWERFKAGDFSKWNTQQKDDLTVKPSPIGTAVKGTPDDQPSRTSAASDYKAPGSGVKGGDKLDLTSNFTSAANPAVAPQGPVPQGPAVVTQRTVSTQTFNV